MMRNQKRRMQTALLVVLFGMSITFSAGAIAGENDSQEISKTLSLIKTEAFGLQEDAAQMQTYALVRLPIESRRLMIKEVTAHISEIVRQLSTLKAKRHSGSDWQQAAIDRITPLVNELVSNTTAVIDIIENASNETSGDAYREYLEANVDQATRLSTLISTFVDYGKAKQRLDRLANKLELH